MRRIFATIVCTLLACAVLPAQIPPTATLVFNPVTATGTSTINVPPDQAQLNIGVVTQGATAQEAGTLNASLSTTVQNALKAVLGTGGTIQTVGYSVYPRYSTGNTQTITGYTASNTVQVTTTNLSIVGSLIDTANQAGANNVSGVNFGLQNPDPALQTALTAATKQALAHAAAIAAGLGVKTGAILSAVQGSSYTPTPIFGAAPTASTTPIQTGTVGVSATVTVSVALVQ